MHEMQLSNVHDRRTTHNTKSPPNRPRAKNPISRYLIFDVIIIPTQRPFFTDIRAVVAIHVIGSILTEVTIVSIVAIVTIVQIRQMVRAMTIGPTGTTDAQIFPVYRIQRQSVPQMTLRTGVTQSIAGV